VGVVAGGPIEEIVSPPCRGREANKNHKTR
jgi:hypothetical protein